MFISCLFCICTFLVFYVYYFLFVFLVLHTCRDHTLGSSLFWVSFLFMFIIILCFLVKLFKVVELLKGNGIFRMGKCEK
jgi:hypothetical protein